SAACACGAAFAAPALLAACGELELVPSPLGVDAGADALPDGVGDARDDDGAGDDADAADDAGDARDAPPDVPAEADASTCETVVMGYPVAPGLHVPTCSYITWATN